MKSITNFPLYRCFVREDWQEMGLAPIFIARSQSNKKFIVGIYLVDTFALGVKDICFRENITKAELNFLVGMQEIQCPCIELDYEDARSIILGSIEYSAQFGFSPHADWHKAKHLIEHDREFNRNVTFGLDGKPFYYRGPNDINVEEIVKKITAAGGDYCIDIEESEHSF